MKITTDFVGSEDAATRRSRRAAILDAYFGAGTAAAAGTQANALPKFNSLLNSPISDGEAFGSWGPKMNILNDTLATAATVFSGITNAALFAFDTADGNLDSASAPVTSGTPLATSYDKKGGSPNPAGVTMNQPTAALRGLWVEDSTGGYWSPDLTDDAIRFTLPAAVDGEVFIIGRSGSWREARAAALGATVTIGGTGAGTTGTPGILNATGGIIACGFRAGTMTDTEWTRLMRCFRPKGALGNISIGAEMLTNGGFAADLTGWTTLLGTVAWEAGGVRCTSNGTQVGRIGQSVTGSLTGKQFLVSGQCVSVGGGAVNGVIYPSTGAGQVGALGLFNISPGAPARRCYTFTADTIHMIAQSTPNTNGFSALFDNLSIKPLIVEAL